MFNKKITMIIGLFFFLCGCFLPIFFEGQITGEIYKNNGELEKSDYRFFRSNDSEQKFTYKLQYPLKRMLGRSISVFPNDCITSLTINGKPYTSLKGDLCDERNGVLLDELDGYLIEGNNIFEFKITQNGNSSSFYMKPSIWDPIRMVSFICLGIGLLLMLYSWFFSGANSSGYFLFDNKKKFYLFLFIFILMYTVGWVFLIQSEFFQRSFDQGGHLDYFKLLIRGDRNPPSNMCRQCYHPTTYYRFYEYIYKIGSFFHRAEPFDLIRVLTFFVWWIGIIYAYKLIYSILYAKQGNYLHFICCILLFSFRPLQFYFGARISNEVRNHSLSYITIFYARLAYDAFQSRNESVGLKNTLISLVLVSFGLLIKTNSFIWGPSAIIGLFLYCCSFGLSGFFKKLWNLRLWILKTIFICGIFVYLSIGLAKVKGVNAIIDNMNRINPGNSVSQYPILTAFTTFSVDQFIRSKDIRSSKDSIETKSFRSFLSKTMILGEFIPIKTKNTLIVEYLMMSSFVIICILLLSLLVYGRKDIFLLVGWIVPIFAMMANRVVNQYGSAMHYRLILPHIIFTSLVICASLGYYKYKLKGVLYVIVITCIILFVLFSFIYSIPPYF